MDGDTLDKLETPRERPILFSGEMVRQLLVNTKTQTRRLIKSPSMCSGVELVRMQDGYPDGTRPVFTDGEEDFSARSPYGQPGDWLWVKETFWSQHDTDVGDGYEMIDCGPDLTGPKYHPGWEYCATPACESPPKPEHEQTVAPHEGPPVPGEWWLAPPDDWNGEDDDRERRGTWVFLPWELYTKHPSIHMPRWASRITLEVTGVRVERLHDISEADILAEGVTRETVAEMIGSHPSHVPTLQDAWRLGWTHIYGAEIWEANPWLWVIEFRRVEGQ